MVLSLLDSTLPPRAHHAQITPTCDMPGRPPVGPTQPYREFTCHGGPLGPGAMRLAASAADDTDSSQAHSRKPASRTNVPLV